jgi:hypothetical protein
LVVWSLIYLALRDALELVLLAGCRPPARSGGCCALTGLTSRARRASTSWRLFLRQQVAGIVACDLLDRSTPSGCAGYTCCSSSSSAGHLVDLDPAFGQQLLHVAV